MALISHSFAPLAIAHTAKSEAPVFTYSDEALDESLADLEEQPDEEFDDTPLSAPADFPRGTHVTGRGIACNTLMEMVDLDTVPPPTGTRFLEELKKGIPADDLIENVYLAEFGGRVKTPEEMQLEKENDRKARRMDRTIIVVTAPAWFPLLAGASFTVWLGNVLRSRGEQLDPRDVFFKQVRAGQYGKPLTVWKLKTMRDDIPGPAHTMDTDPRVTWEGEFLRKFKIDELPQICNVWKDEMAIVGPRPQVYGDLIGSMSIDPKGGYKLLAKQGLTSIGQILNSHCKTARDNLDKVRYELFETLLYQAPPKRAKTILRTFFSIVKKKR